MQLHTGVFCGTSGGTWVSHPLPSLGFQKQRLILASPVFMQPHVAKVKLSIDGLWTGQAAFAQLLSLKK